MKKFLSFFLSTIAFVGVGGLFISPQVDAVEIGDIIVRFCDEQGLLEKQVSFEMDPLQAREICLKVFNTSDEEASVQLAFVDGTITKDESKYKACLTANDTKNFGKFARMEDSLVKVPARDAVETFFTLEYPSGYAGMSYGCVVSKVLTDTVDSEDGMMSVELRQGHFIDVFVNGDILLDVLFDIVDTQSFPSAFIEFEHEKFSSLANTSVRIVNSGNIAQDVVVHSSVLGWFGFAFDGKEQTVRLNPGESRVLSDQVDLPWYGFGVDVQYSASATPVFEFDSSIITDEMRETKQLGQEISVFLIPYWLLVCLAVILIVMIFFIISGEKKRQFALKASNIVVSNPKKKSKSVIKKSAKKSVVSKAKTSSSPTKKLSKKASVKPAKKVKKTTTKPVKKTLKKVSKKK